VLPLLHAGDIFSFLSFSLGNFANKGDVMSRQFVAFINGSTTSGLKDDRQKAIDWAQEQLNTLSKHTAVHICEVVAVVERAAPPITVREIVHEPETVVDFKAA
jgi:hypothetical protein